MGTFEENVRPTAHAVAQIFGLLCKEKRPLSLDALSVYLDLMLLPCLNGLASVEARAERLRFALDVASQELTNEHQLLYRRALAEPDSHPPHKRWGSISDAVNALPSRRDNPIVEGTVRKNAQKMFELLAKTLVDPNFAVQLDEDHPVERTDSPQSTSASPADAYELLEYAWELDISADDPRLHLEHRKMKARMTLPHQRVLGLRYYTDRVPGAPDSVTIVDSRQKYLDTFPDPLEGAPSKWWMHFVHLGERKALGAEVTVEMHERYLDAGEGEQNPYLARLIRSEAQRSLILAIRLPLDRVGDTKPEARVIRDPYDQPEPVDKWTLDVSKDGWVRESFKNLQTHLQYGIFLPGFGIYKR